MKTITQIGKAALTRLFNPGSVYDKENKTQTITKIVYPESGFNIVDRFKERSISDILHNPQTYMVWSIALGLVELEPEEGETFLDAVTRAIKGSARNNAQKEQGIFTEAYIPSHIIFLDENCFADTEYTLEENEYQISRLTETQELAIQLSLV